MYFGSQNGFVQWARYNFAFFVLLMIMKILDYLVKFFDSNVFAIWAEGGCCIGAPILCLEYEKMPVVFLSPTGVVDTCCLQ